MEQSVQFKNHRKESLSGTLHMPDTLSDRGVVIGHCFTCSRHTRILQQIAHDLAQAGFLALRFDFSGNGQSEGAFAESSYSKHIAEMRTAADFLMGKGATWIGLAGHSMGAAISILSAAESSIFKSVCVLAGRLSSTDATRFFDSEHLTELKQKGEVSFTSRGRRLKLSKTFFEDAGRYNLPGKIAALKTRLLVVHGERDEIVPVAEAYAAQKLNPSAVALSIIPEADHMFSDEAHRRHVAALAVDWFTKASRYHSD